MSLPTLRLTKVALARLPERYPVSHYVREKNAAEALAVTLATSIPENCNSARAEARKSLPQRPMNNINYLQQWTAEWAAMCARQAGNNGDQQQSSA